MNILAIETTGANASVAIINEKNHISEEISDRKLSHLQSLMPMVDNLLEKCQLSIADITHIAISEGPGSFTGIRIGMAAGKALAQALNLPVISVPTLGSFCFNVTDFKGLICPLFDARRKQVYGGAYYRDGNSCAQAIADDAWDLEDFLFKVQEYSKEKSMELLFFGDGAEVYKEAIRQWALSQNRLLPNDDMSRIMANAGQSRQRAASIAAAALKKALEGDTISCDRIKPVYLRKAEAERKLQQGQTGQIKGDNG